MSLVSKFWVVNAEMAKIKIVVVRLLNYIGVVSRLPVASPRHRLTETHYVH